MITRRFGFALLFVALSATAAAQTIPFQLLVIQGQNVQNVGNGATLTLLSSVGQSQTIQFEATYSGTGQATISVPPSVVGSTEFSVTLTTMLPAKLAPGANVLMTIQFTPSNSTAASAQIVLPYLETLVNGTSNTGMITLSLTGTAPSFVLSYALQANQNVVPVQSGGVIAFLPTLVGTSTQAALNITNTGTGAGAVTGITVSGSAFALQGTPPIPLTVAANASVTVQVVYTPSATSSDTGQITITFSAGPGVTLNLTGSGTAPLLTYQILNASTPTSLPPGGAVSLPDTPVGQSSSVSIRILNSGNVSAIVNSISVAGQSFTLSSVPQIYPQTLAPGATLTFTLNFSPTQPGALSGSLFINTAMFTVNGTGLGALLTYSYVASGTTVTLTAASNSVVFSPVAITQSEQLTFDAKNTGTLPATISNIGVGQTAGPFTISGLPPLPVTLAPNADFHLTITFTPATMGFSNGTLLLDSASIPLVGSGTAPPPLPSYTVSGPSGSSDPMTQPSISLTLASAYPVAISGTLAMAVTGTLPADPAVQFATGGRTVSFVIPPNQTGAVFGSVGAQIGMQTGTVASTITLTPSFETQAGSVDLTPNVPASLQFNVAAGAPTLIALQLAALTTTGFTLQATGFATTRSLKSVAVQLTTAPGFSMPATQFTIDVSQVSTLWFQNAASQAYGGQFTLSIPFSFGSLPAKQSVVNAITSVAITVSNAAGSSNSVQSTLQ